MYTTLFDETIIYYHSEEKRSSSPVPVDADSGNMLGGLGKTHRLMLIRPWKMEIHGGTTPMERKG
jgi:hypothetical protein